MQELERFNNLRTRIQRSCAELQRAVKGLAVMSAELESMATSLLNNQVNIFIDVKQWAKKFPTCVHAAYYKDKHLHAGPCPLGSRSIPFAEATGLMGAGLQRTYGLHVRLAHHRGASRVLATRLLLPSGMQLLLFWAWGIGSAVASQQR